MLTRLKNLNLRFLGEEGDGTEGGDTQVEDQGSAPVEQAQQPSGGNPAWEALRSELDPITFSKIEPHLKNMDKAAQARIESVNSRYAPFQQSLEGRQPDYIQKAVTYAEQLDSNPEQVYQMLGQFLQQNGRLPSAQEAEEALDEQEGDEAQPQSDPRLDQVVAYIQQQARQQQEYQAETELASSLSALQAAHPELSKDDTNEIIKRAAFAAQQNPGQDIDFNAALERGYAELAELRNRILTAPRPGDSAPQLPPLSGGAPSTAGQQQKKWSEYSSGDIQSFIAGQLAQQNKG